MKNIKDDQNAVSDVIGEVMMVAVAVVAFAILTTLILSLFTPSNPPRADMGGWVNVTRDVVHIQHRGGEALNVDNMELILNLNGTLKTLNSTDIGSIVGVSYMQLGDSIDINTSSLWGISLNETDTISSTLIYGNVVLSRGILMEEGEMGVITPSSTPTPTPMASDAIYTDSLGTGWTISHDEETKVKNDSRAYTGTRSLSIEFVSSGWVRFSGNFDTTGYTDLEFYIYTKKSGGQTFDIFVSNATGDLPPVSIPPGYVEKKKWKKVTIPLSDLNATNMIITAITFRENRGDDQKKIYIDDYYIR